MFNMVRTQEAMVRAARKATAAIADPQRPTDGRAARHCPGTSGCPSEPLLNLDLVDGIFVIRLGYDAPR
jgi:hypothetical protein